LEVEAKLSIPDEQTFQRLLEATSLAGYSQKEPKLLHLHDQYLDTAEGGILAGGYACRIRQQDDLVLATLKGLGTVSGAIHRRLEHEVELPRPLPPQHWPASAARDLALRLGGREPLVPLFEAEQSRHRSSLCDGDRLVAELNLDRVRLFRESATAATYLELEVELVHGGSWFRLPKNCNPSGACNPRTDPSSSGDWRCWAPARHPVRHTQWVRM